MGGDPLKWNCLGCFRQSTCPHSCWRRGETPWESASLTLTAAPQLRVAAGRAAAATNHSRGLPLDWQLCLVLKTTFPSSWLVTRCCRPAARLPCILCLLLRMLALLRLARLGGGSTGTTLLIPATCKAAVQHGGAGAQSPWPCTSMHPCIDSRAWQPCSAPACQPVQQRSVVAHNRANPLQLKNQWLNQDRMEQIKHNAASAARIDGQLACSVCCKSGCRACLVGYQHGCAGLKRHQHAAQG